MGFMVMTEQDLAFVLLLLHMYAPKRFLIID